MNYPDTGSKALQAMGRAWRAGGKSKVLQRIIFAAGVENETNTMKNVNKTLRYISAINNGDVTSHNYDIEIMENKKELDDDIIDDSLIELSHFESDEDDIFSMSE
jgi:hypothetical protein